MFNITNILFNINKDRSKILRNYNTNHKIYNYITTPRINEQGNIRKYQRSKLHVYVETRVIQINQIFLSVLFNLYSSCSKTL